MKPHIGGSVALLATAAVLALPTGSASAAAGGLDPSFDKDGRTVLPYGGRPAVVLTQPDGRTIVAGTTAKDELAAWRLRADGSVDGGFGDAGAAVVAPGDLAELTAAALQPDGKILLAGITYTVKGPYSVLVRLNANGSPDDSFKTGQEGLVGGGPDTITAVLVQPDGRIVVAGRSGSDFALARLYSSGAPDGTSFDPGDFGGFDTPTEAALRRDGTIVLAGTSEVLELDDYAPTAVVARYRADGKLDEQFAGTGKRTLGPGRTAGLVAQGDGKVVVERKSADADSRTLVTRLAANGAYDATFGRGGTATVDLHGPDAPAGLALQGDGKLLVAASAGYDFAAARLTAVGVPDPRYGLGGASLFGFSGVNRATAAALQPDGRLVIAGTATVGSTDRVAVARLLADPPPTPVVRDRVAPVVSRLAASARRVRFALSEPADVRVVVKRRGAGVVRRLSLTARPAGITRAHLRVRRPGRYRVTVTATDRAGNRSLPRRASFRLTHR